MKNKKILFVMALRNRRQRAIESVRSIAKSNLRDNFECLIVQDFDTDNVENSDFKGIDIPVFIINQSVGGLFYKTRLMNIGMSITSNMIIVQQDADILYGEEFLKALVELASNTKNFNKYLFGAPYVESDDMVTPAINCLDSMVRKKGDYVGDTFILYRPQMEMIRGYDERIRMWNEEVDIANRLIFQYKLAYYDMGVVGIKNIHITHSNDLRSFDNLELDRSVALFRENLSKKICILEWQNLGNLAEYFFEDKKILYRNNEGDSTVVKENFKKNVYSIHKIPFSKDSVVLDIGAHIGCFALAVSHKVKEVICYEPETANFLLLCKNIERNDVSNVLPYRKAVASKNGEIDLFINPVLTVLNSPVRKNMSMFSQKVDALSLWDIIQDRHIDVLKIDCEGGEYDIFYNSPKSVLNRIGYIVMEYHDLPEINPEYTGSKLVAYLIKNGFAVMEENEDYDIKGRTGIVILKRQVDVPSSDASVQ